VTRSLTAALVAVAVAAGVAAAGAGPAGSRAAATPAPFRAQTPVLSLRREPALVERTLGDLRLEPALAAALADPAFTPVRATSCLVVARGANTLYSYRATQPEIPASNLKLLTAAAVLDRLGPATRLVTEVRAARAPAGGTVTGDLYLIGGGDPLLRTPDYVATLTYPETLYDDLDALARTVRAAGIVRITGSVVGDESRYDSLRVVPTWKPSYVATGAAGPLSALEVNDGFQSFRPDVGAPRPAQQAASVFTASLRRQGVAVGGPAREGLTPPTAVAVTSMASAPLAATVAEVLRQSDNTGTELLAKELGRDVAGTPSTATGVAAVRATLAAEGLPVAQLAAVDGSGLDRSDRASCQLLIDVLARTGPTGALGAGLPVAAGSGTLVHRFAGTPAAGRLRAKTGTLDGVAALSGFVDAAPGSPAPGGLTFSLILNGLPNAALGDTLEDRVGTVLAMYPQVPPLDQLAPLPVVAS
jgi:D-alanyl-D-alanine carboxypeptidase/D-alanyl-D-alanine-endopeptidase (penicillin-binding protein 4)